MHLPPRIGPRNAMQSLIVRLALTVLACTGTATLAHAADAEAKSSSAGEPWMEHELVGVAELARVIADAESRKPIILDIGVASMLRGGLMIKGSTVIGPATDARNLEKLRSVASAYPKDAELVIYCGCCPFKDCPNIRPAFKLLKEMKFTRLKLLDIPKNLAADWITPGFPTEKQL